MRAGNHLAVGMVLQQHCQTPVLRRRRRRLPCLDGLRRLPGLSAKGRDGSPPNDSDPETAGFLHSSLEWAGAGAGLTVVLIRAAPAADRAGNAT